VDGPNVTIKGLALDGQFVTLLKGIDASDTEDEESASHGLVVDKWYEPTGRVVRDRQGVSRKRPGQVGASE
jgi:hypothetical protein